MLLLVLGLLSDNYVRVRVRWAACLIGLWLLFAPLIFWALHPTSTCR